MIELYKNLKLIVIEDNPGDLLLIEDYLNEEVENLSMYSAKCYKDAANLLKNASFHDAILLDLTLPDLSGEDLVNKVVEHSNGKPIIVLTGYTDKDFGIKSLSMGVADYLLKAELSPTYLIKSICYSIARKRIENQVRISEEKYRNLFHFSPTPMWVFEVESLKFLNVNDAAIKHYGYTRDEFLNMTIKDIRPKEEIELLNEIIREENKEREFYQRTIHHCTKAGKLINVDIQSNEIDFEGKRARLVLATDVSNEIEKELQIIKSNKRLVTAQEIGKLGYWELDLQTQELYWTREVYRIFGIEKNKRTIEYSTFYDRIHADDVEYYNYYWLKAQEGISNLDIEFRIMCPGDSIKHVLMKGGLVHNLSKRPLRFEGVIQDITRQKDKEERLKLLESVIINSKDAVMITKANLEKPGPEIIYVNNAFEKISGYKSFEVMGKSPRFLQGEKTDTTQTKKLKEALTKGEDYEIEIINYNANGKEYWVQLAIAPVLNEKGSISHYISIERDISERKKQEQEKEKLIFELTQNNKDLKEFSYIISHNLRAPLSNLVGLISLIEQIEISQPILKELIEGFKVSTHTLQETINDIGKVIIVKNSPSVIKEKIQFAEVVKTVKKQIRFLIDKNNTSVSINFSAAQEVVFNRTYLESIFLNLLTNSLKYKHPDRDVEIQINSYEENNAIFVQFKDNGLGLDLARYKDRIFGLYQRFHNNTDGKGLGLFLVKSQMEALGGSIEVESEPNKGCSFYLKFKK